MNIVIENFINSLKKLKASNSELPNFVLEMFTVEKKKNKEECLFFNEEKSLLERLVENYSMDNICFADYGFNSQLKKVSESIIGFGTSSHSILGFCKDKDNEEIYEYDRENLIPLYPVAQNQESFLNTLLILMEMYSQKYGEPSVEKKKQIEQQFFPLIVAAAGGEKYSIFFKHIVFW